jgi:hypothetical protein
MFVDCGTVNLRLRSLRVRFQKRDHSESGD